MNRTQVVLVALFVLVNVGLVVFAHKSPPYPGGPLLSPTYHSAADGQRYWGVAINLAEKGSFTIPPLWDSRPEEPLRRSGPLPAIAFSIPIKLVGFDKAPIWIISFQCFLVFIMSLFSRSIAVRFGANKTLLQCLILFNPNLVSLAHFAQSDLLFSFIFSTVLFLLYKRIIFCVRPKLGWFLALGGLIGLLCLTREVGLVIAVSLPVILILTTAITRSTNAPSIKAILRGSIVASFAFLIVVTPWAIRNQSVFQSFTLTSGGGAYLHHIFERLQQVRHPNSSHDTIQQGVQSSVNLKLFSSGMDHCDGSIAQDSLCRDAIRKAYIESIISQPPSVIIFATINAATKTILGGGVQRIADYLGLSYREIQSLFVSPFSMEKFLLTASTLSFSEHSVLFLLSLVAFGFVLFTRIFGIGGLFISVSQQTNRHAHLLHVLLVLAILSAYFVVATTRFRAPLEPILMLYAAIGLTKFMQMVAPQKVRR